jgi:hypothetical protein
VLAGEGSARSAGRALALEWISDGKRRGLVKVSPTRAVVPMTVAQGDNARRLIFG